MIEKVCNIFRTNCYFEVSNKFFKFTVIDKFLYQFVSIMVLMAKLIFLGFFLIGLIYVLASEMRRRIAINSISLVFKSIRLNLLKIFQYLKVKYLFILEDPALTLGGPKSL
jgi:hypothetical protein